MKSNKNGTELKFPVYNDEEIGIDKDNNIILCKHYDNDDDIDTNTSVLEYFQD